jgi:hypothetical protein
MILKISWFFFYMNIKKVSGKIFIFGKLMRQHFRATISGRMNQNLKGERIMKKTSIGTVLFLAVFLGAVNGYAKEHKQVNVFANFGVSASVLDFKGSFLDLGVEQQFKDGFFGQLFIDFYFNPLGRNAVPDKTAYAIYLYCAYKLHISRIVNLFARTGVNLTGESWSYYGHGYSRTEIEIYPGVGAGIGAEFLGKKLSLRLGSDAKFMFGGTVAAVFKFYGGVGYSF